MTNPLWPAMERSRSKAQAVLRADSLPSDQRTRRWYSSRFPPSGRSCSSLTSTRGRLGFGSPCIDPDAGRTNTSNVTSEDTGFPGRRKASLGPDLGKGERHPWTKGNTTEMDLADRLEGRFDRSHGRQRRPHRDVSKTSQVSIPSRTRRNWRSRSSFAPGRGMREVRRLAHRRHDGVAIAVADRARAAPVPTAPLARRRSKGSPPGPAIASYLAEA